MELGLVFKIEAGAGGTYAGTLDVPMQGAAGIPLSEISLQDGRVRIEITAIAAVFTGQLSPDGQKMTGQWQQGGATLPLELQRTERAPALKRPQEPERPYPYVEEEVSYENEAAGIRLAATLTKPEGDGPFPAAILISGSGAQDRDESLLGHRPFLVLADYLTRRGIVVLRADDRGVGGSTGNTALATTADFAQDALAGIRYLRGRADIDLGRIGLIGHSEGGLAAPLAAARAPDEVAFVVLMAGPGVPGEEILYRQTELIMRANGIGEDRIALEMETLRELFGLMRTVEDDKTLAAKLGEVYRTYLAGLSAEERRAVGDEDAWIQGQVGALLTPWFRYFLTHDPRPVLREVACPVLAVFGERDLQVPPEQSVPALEQALREGGNEDYTIKVLPGLNHLFQTCATGSPAEYGVIEETIAPAALQLIGDWVVARTQQCLPR